MVNFATGTAHELQAALNRGDTSSTELVKQCLGHIESHNHYGRNLHALISVAPLAEVTAIAATSDQERRDGHVSGPLHGIPVVIKDNILTSSDMGMDTTGGSIGLVGAKASHSASLVKRLLQAGMIVLGKANLTEFAGLKNATMMPGWSVIGGQTQSPFCEGGMKEDETMLGHTSPTGSSNGSAVSVSAGFAPLSVGTETVGSIVLPAGRAGVYAFRAGFGTVPMDGVIPLTPDFDMIGVFGRCTRDVVDLASCLLRNPELTHDLVPKNSSRPTFGVAFVDPKKWKLDHEICSCNEYKDIEWEQVEAYESAIRNLASDTTTEYPVDLPDISTLDFKHENGERYGIVSTALHQLRELISTYLQSLETCEVRSLEELIAYNDKFPDKAFSKACPNQDILHKVQLDATDPATISAAVTHIKSTARTALDHVFDTYNVKLIAAPADSAFALYAAAAGYPVGTVPFPNLLQPIGRPFGLVFVARPSCEAHIFRFMAIWERVVCPFRPLPPFLRSLNVA